ncbi:MAG: carboxypeptidase-like regulatory domain-containing protein, partial [Bacteroidota bacterium]
MYLRLLSLAIWAVSASALMGQTQTLSGYIKDVATGEMLIGASVFVEGTTNGTYTNENGFYSINLDPGDYKVTASYLGYADLSFNINLGQADQKRNFELKEEEAQIAEVLITATERDKNVKDVQMSVQQLDMATIQKLPSLLGETDVIRSILLLPGVTTVGEGSSGFNVRGGSIDQNLVLLDDAPVYNSSHLFGFFSVFNPDAVAGVELYKGGIPARFGGRLSSILDVEMRAGNDKEFEAQGGIGTIFSRLAIEAPIVKDKGSFLIAGRRSYIDVLAG